MKHTAGSSLNVMLLPPAADAAKLFQEYLGTRSSNGFMKTGWIKDNRSWYYLNDDGTLATDTWIDNYYVSESGKWTKTR